jgi:hypothetical protein
MLKSFVSLNWKKVNNFILSKANIYQDFPSSDNLTRRLKKLIHAIIRREQDSGKIDFDVSEEDSNEEEKLKF